MTVEVVRPHPVEHQQEDRSRFRRRRPDARQDLAGRRARHRNTQRGRDRDRDVLLHGRYGVGPRRDADTRKQHRDPTVVRPGRPVHVRHARLGTREDRPLPRNDQNLTGAAREIPARKHREELRALAPVEEGRLMAVPESAGRSLKSLQGWSVRRRSRAVRERSCRGAYFHHASSLPPSRGSCMRATSARAPRDLGLAASRSLLSERHHRIDARGASGRKVGRCNDGHGHDEHEPPEPS